MVVQSGYHDRITRRRGGGRCAAQVLDAFTISDRAPVGWKRRRVEGQDQSVCEKRIGRTQPMVHVCSKYHPGAGAAERRGGGTLAARYGDDVSVLYAPHPGREDRGWES